MDELDRALELLDSVLMIAELDDDETISLAQTLINLWHAKRARDYHQAVVAWQEQRAEWDRNQAERNKQFEASVPPMLPPAPPLALPYQGF